MLDIMSLSFFILFFRSPKKNINSLSHTHKSMTTINNKLVCPTTMSSPRNRITFAQDLKTLACICVQICLPTAMGPWFVPVGNEINIKKEYFILTYDIYVSIWGFWQNLRCPCRRIYPPIHHASIGINTIRTVHVWV